MRKSISHPILHDFKGIRSDNPTKLLCLSSPPNKCVLVKFSSSMTHRYSSSHEELSWVRGTLWHQKRNPYVHRRMAPSCICSRTYESPPRPPPRCLGCGGTFGVCLPRTPCGYSLYRLRFFLYFVFPFRHPFTGIRQCRRVEVWEWIGKCCAKAVVRTKWSSSHVGPMQYSCASYIYRVICGWRRGKNHPLSYTWPVCPFEHFSSSFVADID